MRAAYLSALLLLVACSLEKESEYRRQERPSAAMTDYNNLDKGERAFAFRTTVHYEPEDQ